VAQGGQPSHIRGLGNAFQMIQRHAVITTWDRCMLFFMNMTTKEKNVSEEKIVATWKREVEELDWDNVVIRYGEMSPRMFTYACFVARPPIRAADFQ